MYVEVSLPISVFKTFTYIVPQKHKEAIFLGQSVVVPFNRKLLNGFIVDVSYKTNYKGKVLSISSINSNCFIIQNELWRTIHWISKYYICPLGRVLNNTISFQHKSRYKVLSDKYVSITKLGKSVLESIKFKSQKEILTHIYKHNNININELKIYTSSFLKVCSRLEELQYIQIKSKINKGDILKNNFDNSYVNSSQNKVSSDVSNLKNKLYKNPLKPILVSNYLFDSKIIIYEKIIKKYLQNKKSIIVLVPEVSLIPQTYRQLNYFFKDQVGIWHNKMGQFDKNFVLKNIKDKKIKIIISTRSGLFLPLDNLGLIIIDEEHESSYKQDQNSPYYHTRDVGLIRAKFSNSSILLFSNTPSVESYYNIKKKNYNHYELNNNSNKKKIPDVRLVDMKNQDNFKYQYGTLSEILIQNIHNSLNDNKQILLLQNRKGYEKSGTQRIQEILLNQFPEAKILIYDRDSISKKNMYFKILDAFNKQKADILIGTQMIAKGLDFKNVNLVGVINADIGLHMPDFRSGEKIFQLIYQLIGRIIQSNISGKAIIQSYNVDNEYINYACQYKLYDSLNTIIKEREELFYPPFSRIIKILFLGSNQIKTNKKSKEIYNKLIKNKHLTILGPSLAPIEKINSVWRVQILIKCKKDYWQKFYDWLSYNISISEFENKKNNINLKIDVDPISIL